MLHGDAGTAEVGDTSKDTSGDTPGDASGGGGGGGGVVGHAVESGVGEDQHALAGLEFAATGGGDVQPHRPAVDAQQVEPVPPRRSDPAPGRHLAEAVIAEHHRHNETVVFFNRRGHLSPYLVGSARGISGFYLLRNRTMSSVIDKDGRLAQAYAQDGVIRLRGLYSPEEVGRIRGELDRYIREVAPGLPEADVVYEADGVSARNLWRMEQHDPFFRQLAESPRLQAFLAELLHGRPVLMGVETFNKPAKVGSGVPAHQDNAYFCQEPPDVLTVWVALDAATEANGPVYYVRGSHEAGTLPHKASGVKGNSMGIDAPYDDADPFVGTLEPGDALVHHGQTIHYSAPNRTDHPRCGMLLVFRGDHTRSSEALREAYRRGQAAVATA